MQRNFEVVVLLRHKRSKLNVRYSLATYMRLRNNAFAVHNLQHGRHISQLYAISRFSI